jgi:hypothetical protein
MQKWSWFLNIERSFLVSPVPRSLPYHMRERLRLAATDLGESADICSTKVQDSELAPSVRPESAWVAPFHMNELRLAWFQSEGDAGIGMTYTGGRIE